MKNRLWRQRSGDRGATSAGCRQDSQESTISTSSSIREFELFQQFCSNTSPDWVRSHGGNSGRNAQILRRFGSRRWVGSTGHGSGRKQGRERGCGFLAVHDWEAQ